MSVVVNNVIESFNQYWSPSDDDFLNKINNDDVLQIGNSLSSLFSGKDAQRFKIEIPNLVVTGSQSSGKSSVLNAILGMDLLPTGSNMVTRVPLNLQLSNDKNTRAEFGHYEDGIWKVDKSVKISEPNPTPMEIKSIRNEIDKQMNIRAGDNKNISLDEIILKVFSPKVPELSLIDLPGLTTISLEDKGQPKDIVEQIKNMIGHYIKNPRTIILVVMPSRTDLETDMALHLVKHFDPTGERSCGILTKIDLMNVGTDISDYLNNNISNSLQLKYGYYAIKNRSTNEVKMMVSIKDGVERERKYFENHTVYRNISSKNRLGIENLRKNLSIILIKHLKANVPDIIREINIKLDEQDEKLLKLGPELPEDSDGKYALLNKLLSEFCRNYMISLNEKCGMNYGLKIKDKFVNYRNDIKKIVPIFSKEIILETIKNSSGNHMDFSIFSIEILEKCLEISNPFELLRKPSYDLTKEIAILLYNLTEILAKHFERFPKLVETIKSIFSSITNDYQQELYIKVDNLINIEKGYIWTENEKFQQDLKQLFKKSFESDNQKIIEKLLISYFETVKCTFVDQIPKLIMCFMVSKIEKNINSELFKLSNVTDNVGTLLEEPSAIHNERMKYIEDREKLEKAKKSLLNVLKNK